MEKVCYYNIDGLKPKSERVIPSSCFKSYVYVYTLKMGGWIVNFTLDTLRKKYSHFLELPLAINIKKKTSGSRSREYGVQIVSKWDNGQKSIQ